VRVRVFCLGVGHPAAGLRLLSLRAGSSSLSETSMTKVSPLPVLDVS